MISSKKTVYCRCFWTYLLAYAIKKFKRSAGNETGWEIAYDIRVYADDVNLFHANVNTAKNIQTDVRRQ
jgi:hypothetical protein